MICISCSINADEGVLGDRHLYSCDGNTNKTRCDCQHNPISALKKDKTDAQRSTN